MKTFESNGQTYILYNVGVMKLAWLEASLRSLWKATWRKKADNLAELRAAGYTLFCVVEGELLIFKNANEAPKNVGKTIIFD